MQQDDEDGKRPQSQLQAPSTNLSIKNLVSNALIIHTDVQRKYYLSEEEFLSDSDVVSRAENISKILQKQGVETTIVPWSEKIPLLLYEKTPDVVINMVETIKGNNLASSSVPALFHLMGIPYTGPSNTALLQNCNKAQIKNLMFEYDLPTPQYELMTDITDRIPKSSVEFPLIVKPNTHMGSSIGIDDTSVCTNWKAVYKKVDQLFETLETPVLIEEFIEGREITAIIIEEEGKKHVYFGEKVFKDADNENTFNYLRWTDLIDDDNDSFEYAPYVDKSGYLSSVLLEAFDVFELTGYAKFDLRLSKHNKPYIIDINADCSLGPGNNAIANVPSIVNVDFETTLYHIIYSALHRESK